MVEKNLGEVLLRTRDVLAKTGIARQTMYDHIKAGTFPKPLKPNSRLALWRMSEIDQWILDRVAERDAGNSEGEAS